MSFPADKKVEILRDTVVAMKPHKKGDVVVISPVDFVRLGPMKARLIEEVPHDSKKPAETAEQKTKKGK